MRTPRWLAIAVAVAALAGCGEGSDPGTTERPGPPPKLREVEVSLNRELGPEHAGLLMSEANGYFADAGLEVLLSSPASPAWPVRYLLSRLVDADFAVSHLPQVAISVENGHPITAVGSLIPEPTAAFIWLKESGIRGVADLKGKTIAVPGLPFQRSFLESLLVRSGVKLEDVKLRYVGYRAVPTLASGRADAIFGGSPQLEGIELRSLGRKPVITPVGSLGVPVYDELVLITTADLAAREPRWVRDFIAAWSRGTAAAARNPQAVLRAIEEGGEPSPVSSRKAREAQIAAILPILSRDGYMDPGQAEGLIGWMQSQGIIEKTSVSDLLTNELLPETEG